MAGALEVLVIGEVATLLGSGEGSPFTPAERAYAQSKPDPERRLAARLAAKRAALRLLGKSLTPADVEVVSGWGGPPRLRLSVRAEERLHALGADRALVSLTHERAHAAAAVLLVRGGR